MKTFALVAGIIVATTACATARHGVPRPEAIAVHHGSATDDAVVIHLEHARAQDIRDVLDELVNASKRQGFGCTLYLPGLVGSPDPRLDLRDPRIVADARTNSLILAIDWLTPDDIAAIRELVAVLDIER